MSRQALGKLEAFMAGLPGGDSTVDMTQEQRLAYISELTLAYHRGEDTGVTDKDFDTMYSLISDEDKVLLGVGAKDDTSTTVSRDVPMLSMDNTYTETDIRSTIMGWYMTAVSHYGETLPNLDISFEFKFDGMAVELEYNEQGILVRASTRGDKLVGTDITKAMMRVDSVPKIIQGAKGEGLTVRGEICLPITKFNSIKEEKGFKSIRNATVGLIMGYDGGAELTDMDLEFIAFHYIDGDKVEPISITTWSVDEPKESRLLELFSYFTVSTDFIKGVLTITSPEFFKDNDKLLMNVLDGIEEMMSSLDLECDGVVVSVCDSELRAVLGSTSRVQKWNIAFKFDKSKIGKQSVLESIEWNISRYGQLAPTGIIKPIEIDGATISRVTIHNLDWCNKKGVKLNGGIIIKKAGSVIPAITDVYEIEGESIIEGPKTCPHCGSDIASDGSTFFCMEPATCKGTIAARVSFMVSNKGLNIKGISDKIIDKLYIQSDILTKVSSIVDIALLTRREKIIEGAIGTSATQKLLAAVGKLSEIKPNNLWKALCIERLASKDIKKLMEIGKQKSYQNDMLIIHNAKEWENLIDDLDMSNVGTGTSDRVYDWGMDIRNHDNLVLWSNMIRAGVKLL